MFPFFFSKTLLAFFSFGLKSNSNTWIGAWWLGFILSAILSITIAIPLLAFPPELPNAEQYRLERESETHGSADDSEPVFTKFKEMPKAFRAILLNPTFFFLNMAGATEGLIISGFSAFLPKVIENQFSVNPANTSIIMGNYFEYDIKYFTFSIKYLQNCALNI